MQVVALVVGVLAFGPLAVRSFDHLTFSPVEQCGPFSISLTGSKESPTLPLTLTVIPFNSSAPLSIPISAGQWQDMTSSPSGANISFLPFAAGTSFVASVDDVNGQAVTTVSDVIGVQPSNTSSCVSANTTASYPYTLTGTPTQCGAFNVSSDPNVVSGVKSVRAFIPKGPAFLLNRTSPNSSSYVMSVKRGLQVVMLVSDGSSHQQTTSLETVQGDSTSSTACLPVQSNQKSAQQNKPALSSGAIIAIAVGSGGAVLVLGFVMLVYIRRERRARNTRRAVRDNEKGIPPFPSQPPLPPLPPEPPLKYGDSPPFSPSSRFIRDAAPYGNDAFLSPTSADHLRKFRRYSMSSAGAGSPHASMGPPSMAPANMEPTSFSMGGARRVLGAGDRSVHSLDIEQMLEMATVYSNNSPRLSPSSLPPISGDAYRERRSNPLRDIDPSNPRSATFSNRTDSYALPRPVSPPAAIPTAILRTRSGLLRGHDREPSDVPRDPMLSMSMSRGNSFAPQPQPESPAAARKSVDSPRAISIHSDTSSSALSPNLSPTGPSPPLFTPYLRGVQETSLDMPRSAATDGTFTMASSGIVDRSYVPPPRP